VEAAVRARPSFFGAAPEGFATPHALAAGRRAMLESCVSCHDIRRIIGTRRTPAQWTSIVERMAGYAGTDHPAVGRHRAAIAAYLIAALGREEPPPTAPVAATATTPASAVPSEIPPLTVSSNAPPDSYAAVRAILDTHCVLCHSGPGAQKGVLLDSFESITAPRPGQPALVVWGDPEGSELYRRVTGASTPRMPITGPPWLADEEIAAIRTWITSGGGASPQAAASAAAVESARPAATAPRIPATPAPGEAVTFAHIKPLLAVNCVRCHTPNGIMGAAPEGLVLSSLELLLGATERSVVIPGNAPASLLLRHITGYEQPRMPFDGPPFLSDAETALVARWIEEGARDEAGNRSAVPVGREVRLEGVLSGQWSVDGIPFRTNAETDFRAARQGSRVEVRATIQPDGSLLATRVRGR
jgi:mono/diheme cytochrome c family protein